MPPVIPSENANANTNTNESDAAFSEIPEIVVALQAAQIGGAVAKGYFDRMTATRDAVAMRSKEAGNLVSDADVETERSIVAAIRAVFPDHHILGEEEAGIGSAGENAVPEHLWIVDPIDGTNNFAHRIPHFAVSIAYFRAGRPICGVVYNPVRDDWFTAAIGRGAYHNGVRARVAEDPTLEDTLIGVGFYYDRGALMEATLWTLRDLIQTGNHGVRRLGTASLDLCLVGIGCVGAYFEYTLSPWDHAAGQLFVTEAGGLVTDCLGKPLPLFTPTSILASNGLLHPPMLAAIQPYFPLR